MARLSQSEAVRTCCSDRYLVYVLPFIVVCSDVVPNYHVGTLSYYDFPISQFGDHVSDSTESLFGEKFDPH
jgi:hypothetical protein